MLGGKNLTDHDPTESLSDDERPRELRSLIMTTQLGAN